MPTQRSDYLMFCIMLQLQRIGFTKTCSVDGSVCRKAMGVTGETVRCTAYGGDRVNKSMANQCVQNRDSMYTPVVEPDEQRKIRTRVLGLAVVQ